MYIHMYTYMRYLSQERSEHGGQTVCGRSVRAWLGSLRSSSCRQGEGTFQLSPHSGGQLTQQLPP